MAKKTINKSSNAKIKSLKKKIIKTGSGLTPVLINIQVKGPESLLKDLKNISLIKYFIQFGEEYGCLNSRIANIKNIKLLNIKNYKASYELSIFPDSASDQSFVDKLKPKTVVNELNRIKKNLIKKIENGNQQIKYSIEDLKNLKFSN